MIESAAIETICQQWINAFPSLQPGVPYCFDNEPFDYVEAFCRVVVRHTAAKQSSMGSSGSRKFERRGNVWVSILTPVGTGRQSSALIADSVRAVYESRDIIAPSGERITMWESTTREGAPEDKWSMLSVITGFLYIDTR